MHPTPQKRKMAGEEVPPTSLGPQLFTSAPDAKHPPHNKNVNYYITLS